MLCTKDHGCVCFIIVSPLYFCFYFYIEFQIDRANALVNHVTSDAFQLNLGSIHFHTPIVDLLPAPDRHPRLFPTASPQWPRAAVPRAVSGAPRSRRRSWEEPRLWTRRKVSNRVWENILFGFKNWEVSDIIWLTRGLLCPCDRARPCDRSLCIVMRPRRDFQRQEGRLKVIAYGSRTISAPEKNYHPHSGKLEFFAMKWAICERVRDYLYYTPENNPLTYVLIIVKLNATLLRWVAELADF